MSNKSQRLDQESSLQYSASGNGSVLDYDRIANSLQYLDKVRSINKKIFEAKSPSNLSTSVSPLDRLMHSQRQVTYIDNQRLYGIVKVENLSHLKSKVAEFQLETEKLKIKQEELSLKNSLLQTQLSRLRAKEIEQSQTIAQIKYLLEEQSKLRIEAEQQIDQLNQQLWKLSEQRLGDSQRYSALKSQLQALKTQNQQNNLNQNSFSMICETQTEFYKPLIELQLFKPNLEEIIRKLREKEGQEISRPTLKQIVSESLNSFVKELDAQYKLIQAQSIDLANLHEKNKVLTQESIDLRKKLEEINIEEEKLHIFKNCMASFLDDTSQTINRNFEPPKNKLIPDETSVPLVTQNLEESTPEESMRLINQLKQTVEELRKENIHMLSIIGEYQCKSKSIEKILEESKVQEIPNDGAVGQIVKMSKLVKQSIRSLLQQI